jgi:hypothetical protein
MKEIQKKLVFTLSLYASASAHFSNPRMKNAKLCRFEHAKNDANCVIAIMFTKSARAKINAALI